MTDEALNFSIESFSGPLDLLLHLIKEKDLDLFDIPIVELADQYLHYIEEGIKQKQDISEDYLVMLASLIEMKTKSLLPKPRETKEDPKEKLVQQLLMYRYYQEVGQVLEERQQQRKEIFSREEVDLSLYQKEVKLDANSLHSEDLFKALLTVVERFEGLHPMTTVIEEENYSVDEGRSEIEEVMDKKKSFSFFNLLDQRKPSRSRLVGIFLALLVMVKEGKLTLRQINKGDIIISERENDQ